MEDDPFVFPPHLSPPLPPPLPHYTFNYWTKTQSCQMKTIRKVINMLTIFTLCLFVFVIWDVLLYCSIIIHLYKPCLVFCYLLKKALFCFFYSQWTRWWRFCPVWAPQASQRCFLWGMQNLWVIYSFLLFRFSLTLLLLLLLLLLLSLSLMLI